MINIAKFSNIINVLYNPEIPDETGHYVLITVNDAIKEVEYFNPVASHTGDDKDKLRDLLKYFTKKGYDVNVVLATDGISSSVRSNILNGENICTIHNEKHDFNISENKFTQLRDEEYKSALKSLGVKKHNIHISRFSTKDGEIRKERERMWF